uniref:Uncharacterized protein n=1 Tax=Eutreptiella gymnastica TaxID=73025 RepID=A0A7S1IGP2_9EUGL|mmetsp:Transcript_16733/g.29940  ORF Transcript_16733/g.29940 Transcript_16733/m.29940 type:complete len:198 (+) Transcript_16733:112-705(+)
MMDFEEFVNIVQGRSTDDDDGSIDLHIEIQSEVAELVEELINQVPNGPDATLTDMARGLVLKPLLRLANILKYHELQFRETYLHSYDRKDESLLGRIRAVVAENDQAVEMVRDVLLHDSDATIAVTALLILYYTAPQLRDVDFGEQSILEKLQEWIKRTEENDQRRAVATATLAAALETHHVATELVRQGLPQDLFG